MPRIENRARQRIAEHRRRLVEGHAVFRQVAGRLRRVPLELHDAMIRLRSYLRVGFSDQPVESRRTTIRARDRPVCVSLQRLRGAAAYLGACGRGRCPGRHGETIREAGLRAKAGSRFSAWTRIMVVGSPMRGLFARMTSRRESRRRSLGVSRGRDSRSKGSRDGRGLAGYASGPRKFMAPAPLWVGTR